MTPTPRTDEVRGHIAARYNVHGSMSIAYTEMGKWADKLERELEETKAQLGTARGELSTARMLLSVYDETVPRLRGDLEEAKKNDRLLRDELVRMGAEMGKV